MIVGLLKKVGSKCLIIKLIKLLKRRPVKF